MDDKQWNNHSNMAVPMGNITHEPQPYGQLITHGELYYKYRSAQQVDISLKNPTDEHKCRETGLGRWTLYQP